MSHRDKASCEKDIQNVIDEWMETNKDDIDLDLIKMVPKTIKVYRSNKVWQTFYFDVMLPEDVEDENLIGDVVSDISYENIDLGEPDEEEYDDNDDEWGL